MKTIDWAQNMTRAGVDPQIFGLIDWSAGVGLAGHSMGGQAATVGANEGCTSKYNIKAT